MEHGTTSIDMGYVWEWEEYWPEVAPLLQKCLDIMDGEYILDDVKELLNNRDGLLWVVRTQDSIQAAFVTQIRKFPSKTIGTVTFCGGSNLKAWKHIVDVFADYFKGQGCDYFDIPGRKGWGKVYPDFKERYVTYRKVL